MADFERILERRHHAASPPSAEARRSPCSRVNEVVPSVAQWAPRSDLFRVEERDRARPPPSG